MTRGDRLDEGGDVAREWLGMHEIVGTVPFYYIINWKKCRVFVWGSGKGS